MTSRAFRRRSRSALALGGAIVSSLMLGACSISPVYTVRVDNQTNRTLRTSLERRPTLNEIIGMDSARVKPNSSVLLGPSAARPFERVYVVIGDRTDLHALPESVELSRGEWIVTIGAGSITDWGTYKLDVKKTSGLLDEGEDEARVQQD